MAKLKGWQRKKLPTGDFALPGRRYPINDASHARNALSRVSANGTPEEKAKVRAAVHRKYPSIGATEKRPRHGGFYDRPRSGGAR